MLFFPRKVIVLERRGVKELFELSLSYRTSGEICFCVFLFAEYLVCSAKFYSANESERSSFVHGNSGVYMFLKCDVREAPQSCWIKVHYLMVCLGFLD